MRVLVLAALLLSAVAVQAETSAERDQRMAWWREARLGMFIHWGIMSIPGDDFNAMEKQKIPVAEYEKLVQQYNPVRWNAHDVVKMAKDAGQKYLVFVAKHHDGFAMWDSKVSPYNIMHSPYGKDIVREIADECAAQGLVFCLYYSILDWHHPDANPTGWPKYVDYMKAQLRELLTQYGRIGVVWFDGDWIPEWNDDQGRDLAQYVWSLQPKTIINNRVGKSRKDNAGNFREGAFMADFATPEQEMPAACLMGTDWEACMTMNKSWSWNKSDTAYKSEADCIRLLIDTVSKGGNLLLNIGPQPDGAVPEPQRDRLRVLARWMQTNAESIHGTAASPFAKPPAWGRCTKKQLPSGTTRLYLHVFDWPKDGRLVVPGLTTKHTKTFLLADPARTPLVCQSGADQLVIALPAAAPDPNVSVVALDVLEK